MLGTGQYLFNIFVEQSKREVYALRCGRAICWLCQRNWADVGCNHCFRFYHAQCALTDYRLDSQPMFYRTNIGVNMFVAKCNECTLMDRAYDRWEKGTEFKKMPQKTVHRLIESIWRRVIWTITPTISQAVTELSKSWVNCPINFDIIDERVKNEFYQYPYQLLCDLSLINHNLRIVNREATFKESLINFMANVYSLFNRCEACPYCLESSFSERPNWVIETCPWGHPLIFVVIKDQSWPGKLLRYHKSSELVDVLLFGSHEWYQFPAVYCHHFVTTDYAVPITSHFFKKAILDSLKYLNNIVYCFPASVTLNSRSVYPEIKDLIFISKDQSSTSRSSVTHDKWVAERVSSISHFIRSMQAQVEKTPFAFENNYSQAALDARRLLCNDSDDEEHLDNDVIISN